VSRCSYSKRFRFHYWENLRISFSLIVYLTSLRSDHHNNFKQNHQESDFFMCGICGKIYHDHTRQVEPDLLRRMTSVITHRGPDDEGYFLYGNAGLGSRRLSIVGLEDGHM